MLIQETYTDIATQAGGDMRMSIRLSLLHPNSHHNQGFSCSIQRLQTTQKPNSQELLSLAKSIKVCSCSNLYS